MKMAMPTTQSTHLVCQLRSKGARVTVDGDIHFPCSPDSTKAIAEEECTRHHFISIITSQTPQSKTGGDIQQSTTYTPQLDHRGNVSLDVALLDLTVRVKVDGALKVDRVKGTGDQALVDSAGSTQEPKGDDGKP